MFYLCVWKSERQEATRRYEQTTIYVSFLELEIHLKVNNIGSLNDPLNEGQWIEQALKSFIAHGKGPHGPGP